jgi:hypothetical protein
MYPNVENFEVNFFEVEYGLNHDLSHPNILPAPPNHIQEKNNVTM